MNITESLKIAIKCIKANWMRSVLTMLGIIIGITSVIMIVGAGTGVRDYIVGLIEDMGSNAVLVSCDTTQATDSDYITLEDVDNIKTKVSGVERCSPMLMGFGNATIDKTATEATVMMVGVNSDVQFARLIPANTEDSSQMRNMPQMRRMPLWVLSRQRMFSAMRTQRARALPLLHRVSR